MNDGDGGSVELRIHNGEVVVAKVDGKSIPADRVRKSGDGYDILGQDGEVMRHIAAGAKVAPRVDAGPRVRMGRAIEMRPDAEPAGAPKSMIGVGLGSEVEIVYSASDPTRAELRDDRPWYQPLFFLLVGSAFLGVQLVAFASKARSTPGSRQTLPPPGR